MANSEKVSKKNFKVVICGPPHSGKSVFTQQLRRLLLPLGCCGVIESCPDGEGGWSNVTDQSLVGTLRVKGKFTGEFVSWVINSLSNCPQPLVLADVGGVRSPENEKIFRACDAFIIVANPAKEGELVAWEEFGKVNGCKPIALLDSVLVGETVLVPDVGDGVVRGTQAGLERGEKVGGPVIEAVVNALLDAIGRPEFSPGELEADVHTGHLADQLGISAEERDARLGFRPWHAPTIRALSSEALAQNQCRIWGVTPGWLPAMLASHSSGVVQLWDIRLGWVEIPELDLSAWTPHLLWEVDEAGDFTVVKFQIPGGVFDIRQLAEVTAPRVSLGSRVVINGRGPHWLTTAIAVAYARQGFEVAVLSLHESSMLLPDGTVWATAHQGMVPAVVVSGKKIGQLVAVPNGH